MSRAATIGIVAALVIAVAVVVPCVSDTDAEGSVTDKLTSSASEFWDGFMSIWDDTAMFFGDAWSELESAWGNVVSHVNDAWYDLTHKESKSVVTELNQGELSLSGSIVNDVMADVGNGQATLICNLDGTIQWYLKDTEGTYFVKNGDVYMERGYEVREGSTLTFTEPGRYQVLLYQDGEKISSGTLTIDGTVYKSFEWKQSLGKTYCYQITYDYMFSDYLSRAYDPSAVRHSTSSLPDSRFVTVSDITPLEEALRSEYLSVRGSNSSVTGQDYADYLLSFVQCCIEYPDQISKGSDGYYYLDKTNGIGELFLYGMGEYWAYPLETLHHGYGDCEDTSFLAAALFKAAGYTTGVLAIPGHMVAFVGLEEFVDRPLIYTGMTKTAMRLTATGEKIYYCETTTSSFYYAGYLSEENSKEVRNKGYVSLVD